jgi:retinal rod rhodopsin-sensitive cGMP 3',5'-cyclic phosphodiesterase subunit delta
MHLKADAKAIHMSQSQLKLVRDAAKEVDDDAEADAEFERLKNSPNEGTLSISHNLKARKVAEGFVINDMNMRDAGSGKLMWATKNWGTDVFENVLEEEIPKEILKCRAIAREIKFTSKEQITSFRLEQRVYFSGTCIEEWFFNFGFVIPGSTNTWQQIIEAAPPEKMLSAEVLSGNVTFETSFFDGPTFLCKNLVRIYYV